MPATFQFYREQAKRCRDLAAAAIKPMIREGLLEMAADFDRFADELEARPSPSGKAPS